ncbi:DNA polymerase III subunit epsilon [Planctomycetales bacterium]|nr:DNA polymerase III subunit epsilon [Planctomycetales bacterium]GHT05330.1 DNA polymerase III subunit epsilon [Planctomycetales bacterium]GHV20097.1 DNA polymerase III subunit epsilon [Planctomycetales bacterium]
MYPEIVTLDLETTGIEMQRDEILEIGAAIIRDGKVVSTFSRLAKPTKPLSPDITRITGITNEMVADAPPLAEVLAEFLAFLPAGALCAAHQAQFDRGFLKAATDRFTHRVIDTVGLARILFPELESHSLSFLCAALNITNADAHRALADALALAELWQRLADRALHTPPAVVSEINFLLAVNPTHPYCDYFQRVESELSARHFGDEGKTLFALYPENNLRSSVALNHTAPEKWTRLAREKIEWVFGEDGALAQAFAQFTPRPGQIRMAGEVVEAFNQQKHLLIEAGTGTGKTLAYLIPAVIWARENRVPVVISTNTKNLQEQLFEKDLALVKQALGIEVKAALLKGRSNYLCLRKLEYLLRNADNELDLDDRLQLLSLLTWSVKTESGDIAENIVFSRPDFMKLWLKLRSHGDDCSGRKCHHYRRCFLRKARAAAMNAEIVVANHSLIFADLDSASPALPPFYQLIFDEAHNLEDAATSHLSVEITPHLLDAVGGRLSRAGRKKSRVGLLVNCSNQLADAGEISPELRDQAAVHNAAALDAMTELYPRSEAFFLAVDNVRLAHRDQPPTLRFSPDTQRSALWREVAAAKEPFAAVLGRALTALKGLLDDLKQLPDETPWRDDMTRDLEGAANNLRQFGEDLAFALAADNADYVYWLERQSNRQGDVKIIAAPLAVGALLRDKLYAKKQSIVFCSATMTTNGQFNFLRRRLGLDGFDRTQLTELNVGLAFDYAKQCRIFAPTFLCEPNEAGKNYAEELADLLVAVFRQTAGRALGLFTSYEMLRRVFQFVTKEMLNDGIEILAQGQSGSRKSITTLFQQDIHSVLLGTHSFWEGVDVIGESLSCLVIARLPFAAPNDPLNEARCERVEHDGGNAFIDYTMPNAIIKFRQGFGRLIRHPDDHGVVIVADRRIVAKKYGFYFQKSVPCPTISVANRDDLLARIKEFLRR